MRHLLWAALGVSTLVTGCDNPGDVHISTSSATSSSDSSVLKVVDNLQCPQSEDVLTRKGSADATGQSCTYAGPRGTEVQLRLISLDATTAEEALGRIEAELSGDLPEAARAIKERARTEADAARAEAEATQANARADRATAQAEATATASDQTQVRLPGLKVDSQGDHAVVHLPGMKIEADGDKSVVRIGGIVIRSDSKDETSQITIPDNSSASAPQERVSIDANRTATRVRAFAPGESIRASYRLTLNRDQETNWRAVGYEARGPVGGPIVVAIVRSRAENDDRVFDAAKALVTLNVGK